MRKILKWLFGTAFIEESYDEYFEAISELNEKLDMLERKTYKYEQNRQELLEIISNLYINDAVYKATLKLNNQDMLVLDLAGRVVRTSPGLESILGINGNIDNLKLEDAFKNLNSSVKDIFKKLSNGACNTGGHGYVINSRSLRIRCSILKDHNQMIIGKLLLIDDVTDRIKYLNKILDVTKSKKIIECVNSLKFIIFKKGDK